MLSVISCEISEFKKETHFLFCVTFIQYKKISKLSFVSKQIVGLKQCFFFFVLFFFNVTARIPKALGNNGKIFLCEATDLK